jgi:Superfamily II DNA/RNA helicases, SNF2 family
LKNGRIALIDTGALEEFNEVLRDCAPQQHAKGYRFSDVQAGFLDATLRHSPAGRCRRGRLARSRGATEWPGETHVPAARPARRGAASLPATGRGLVAIPRENKFGGILADEMGLGKTLQTLAFIHSCHTNRKLSGPVLIVCPPRWSSTGWRRRRSSRPG